MIGGGVKLDLRPLGYLRGSQMNKAIRKAMNKAAAPVKQALVAAAPSRTGALRKSIRIRIKYYSKTRTWAAVVGPSRQKKKPQTPAKRRRKRRRPFGPTRYAWQLEFGTSHGRSKPWLRPTLRATRGRFGSILTQALKANIAQVLQGQR